MVCTIQRDGGGHTSTTSEGTPLWPAAASSTSDPGRRNRNQVQQQSSPASSCIEASWCSSSPGIDLRQLRRSAKRALVYRHFMAALTERMWEFAVVVLLTVVGVQWYVRGTLAYWGRS